MRLAYFERNTMKSNAQIISENKEWAIETLKKVDAKMSRVTVRSRDKLADGVDENHVHKDNVAAGNVNCWTGGFWGGMNAQLYKYTGNEDYLKTLLSSEKLLDVLCAGDILLVKASRGVHAERVIEKIKERLN